jgi:two-component system chemotaxis response regulator CheY
MYSHVIRWCISPALVDTNHEPASSRSNHDLNALKSGRLLNPPLGTSVAVKYEHCVLAIKIFTTIKEGVMGEFKSGFFMSESACNGRVLVVDDEPDIRKVVRMTLQKAGYEVIEAENGEKAIEAINTGENRLLLDVLVCDIRMPKINGVEAIAYFQQEWPRVPIIVLTGFPDTDMATSFLRSGVVDYLVKPVEGEKLRTAVARAMEQRELARL